MHKFQYDKAQNRKDADTGPRRTEAIARDILDRAMELDPIGPTTATGASTEHEEPQGRKG